LDSIVQDAQSKIIELSREIAIKQAELEQENLKFTISQIITLEDMLIKEFLSFTQLSFEVAKYKKDYELSIYNASLTALSSKIEIYKAYTISYETKLKGELSKLDVFKAEIEGERLSFEANAQKINIYTAAIDGIKASVDIYKTEISAISERLQAETAKVTAYSAEIQAYSTLVQAKTSEYSAYSEQIKGELAKVEIYNSQVNAYAARVSAYSAKADVLIKNASFEESIEDLKIKKYVADSDAYIKSIQSDQAAYSNALDLYKGQVEVYNAKIGYNTSVAGIKFKNIESTLAINKAKADIAIQNATLSLQALSQAHQSAIAGKSAAGSIHQAIGSSALNAINVSAGVSGTASIGISEDHRYEGV
jgi:chromosome segregation ATPase